MANCFFLSLHFDGKFVELITKISSCNEFISNRWLPNLFICRYDSHETRTPPSPSCFALRSRPSPIFRVRSNAWLLSYERSANACSCCCDTNIYGKTALNEEIPVNKCQKKITHNMSKLVFIVLKSSNCG